MANAATAPVLSERTDIHKSCKSLETLLNILNDYCEAAGAIVSLQKKLAKAMREAAGLKTTADVAGNALGTSATIFEALSEIDSKFAKFTDKEYDGISAEVKKWFKRLAKEEKAHDERIATANMKIKQAGQAYEKKSKKNAAAASDEHARYINLISSLGPEISQDKYNHALQVTQRHASTTQSVAACLARIADAEWLRACESVRRFGPTIGQLGEWRSLCEGGWNGPPPADLPNVEDPEVSSMRQSFDRTPQPIEPDTRDARLEPPASRADNPQTSPATSPLASPRRLSQRRTSISPVPTTPSNYPPSSFDPPRNINDPSTGGSVRSLSEFPAPPTHFPIPPTRASSQTDTPSPPTLHREPARVPSSTASNVSFPMPRLTESPLPEDGPEEDGVSSRGHSVTSVSPVQQRSNDHHPDVSPTKAENDSARRVAISQPAAGRNNPPAGASGMVYPRGDYFDDRDRDSASNDAVKMNTVERSDTGTSVVSSLKARYTNGSGTSSSPPAKEIPRLPLSVSNLASRYEVADASSSTLRARAASPPIARRLSSPAVDMAEHARLTESAWREPAPPAPLSAGANISSTRDAVSSNSTSGLSAAEDVESRRRRQRTDELSERELKEKERELRERELEIQRRAEALERERAQLMSARNDGHAASDAGNGPSPVSVGGHSPMSARERPLSAGAGDGQFNPSALRHRPQYSYSTTHLVPPSSGSRQGDQSHGQRSQPSSPRARTSSHASQSEASEHAPYCGCDRCSASKYRSPSSPMHSGGGDLRSPDKPKPKGWIRRLSMPVGNAFSLDSAKRHSNSTAANHAGVGSGMFSLDGRHKASSGALHSVQEDGRIGGGGGLGIMTSRPSYDSSAGISNRSVTSLGLGGRR